MATPSYTDVSTSLTFLMGACVWANQTEKINVFEELEKFECH